MKTAHIPYRFAIKADFKAFYIFGGIETVFFVVEVLAFFAVVRTGFLEAGFLTAFFLEAALALPFLPTLLADFAAAGLAFFVLERFFGLKTGVPVNLGG